MPDQVPTGSGEFHQHDEDHEERVDAQDVTAAHLVVEPHAKAAQDGQDNKEDTHCHQGVQTTGGQSCRHV